MLNRLLFGPLLRIQEERQRRTTGLVGQAQKSLDHYLELFNQYQKSVKDARMAGYRRQEEVRAEALRRRAGVLGEARQSAERQVRQSRAELQVQVQAAREQLSQEAQEIARVIASALLQRPA